MILYTTDTIKVYTFRYDNPIDIAYILRGKRMRKSVREFLTVDEIAKELRVSWKTVVKFIQNGELPAIKVGRNYRILKSDYQDFLKRQHIQPPEEPTSP